MRKFRFVARTPFLCTHILNSESGSFGKIEFGGVYVKIKFKVDGWTQDLVLHKRPHKNIGLCLDFSAELSKNT